MDYTKRFFLQILNCFINKLPLNKPTDEVDWRQLVYLAETHDVQGIVWVVLEDSELDIPDDVCSALNAAFIATVSVGTRQDIALKQLKAELSKEKIPHVLMKGSVVREYYPVKELRTMGDIDYLIHAEDREKSHYIMEHLRYKLAVKGASVWEYNGPMAYVEVHTKIIYQKLFLGIDYTEYFSDVFDNLTKVAPYTYEMTPEYHFVYIVVHLSKHLFRVGCGVRMIMDIPVFINHFRDKLDWRLLEEKFREIKMWDFVKNLLFLCVKYFDCELPENVYTQNDEIAQRFIEYILAAGIFGRDGRDEYAVKFGAVNANKTGLNKALGKLKTLISLLFPDYETMSSGCGWFKGKPKWMLPWGWVKRAYIQVRYKKDLIGDKLSGTLSDSREGKEHYMLMKMIGLIK